MNSIGALTSVAAAGLQQADQGAGTTVPMLKKAMQADKDLVAALLPAPSPENGRVDIRA